MHEVVANLHSHSVYSDGWTDHETLAQHALAAGLDVVAVTDHNVYVEGLDGYRHADGRRVLLVTGEEIHDAARRPQKNHLLVYEARRELAALATSPARLLEAVAQCGGLAVLAHPVDPGAPGRPDTDLSWVDWELGGFHGLEIWNLMTEFKALLRSRLWAALYAYRPDYVARAPYPDVLRRWDGLAMSGRAVVGVGGSDAHAFPGRLGPLRRTILPTAYLFRAVNTHVLLDEPLRGDPEEDRLRFFDAVRRGRCYVGYGRPASPRGFRFQAQAAAGAADMGGRLAIGSGATLQIRSPRPAEIRLLRNGAAVADWTRCETAVQVVTQPGAYRVEAYLPFRGALRGWVFTNPIYLSG